MTRDEVITKLKATEHDLRSLGIEKLFLFGSFARDQGTDESDVDLLADPVSPDGGIGFRSYFGALDIIERQLGKRIDLVIRRNLHRIARPDIEREALKVF